LVVGEEAGPVGNLSERFALVFFSESVRSRAAVMQP
jgi:hypothetical protein